MARPASPFGPSVKALLEDAPVALAIEVILHRDSDADPAFDERRLLDQESDDDARGRITGYLAQCRGEQLQPLEVRCRRILELAEGKGPTSLDTVVLQQMMGEALAGYRAQADALCRSAWTYLHHHGVFENAESFHFARQFRDHGRLYDAFEVDAEKPLTLNAASVAPEPLAQRITEVLKLDTACTVHALDLPSAADYPASVMVIVRHGGPLSSVFHHSHDGRRGTIYYRPPNEAVLIFTPKQRQIEICADSSLVRQEVAKAFAMVTLGQDLSRKPLTWRRYNLTRFRDSFQLPLPAVDGVDLQHARVLEAEIRLGDWSRKLALKVGRDDDIDEVATSILGKNNILQRAASYNRIAIAVAYNRHGDARTRTLNITVTGDKRSNLQSNKDPEARSLGYRLLREWGILSAFRQIEADDLSAMLPAMLALYDNMEPEVIGAYLRELGLDPDRLIEGGLLERRGRQQVVLLDAGGDGTVRSSSAPGMVRVFGAFGEDLGERPAADLMLYQVKDDWLHEMLAGLIRPILNRRAVEPLDTDLTMLGTMQLGGADVPVYLSRRMDDLATLQRLDLALRARNSAGVGIVLSAGAATLNCLGPNVVVPLHSALSCDEPGGPVLLRDALELAFRSQRTLALGGSTVQLLKSSNQSATLHIPGRPPLAILGANQIKIFESLVAAHNAGSPDVKASRLVEDLTVNSPQQAFRKEVWASILDVYITKGAKHGYWRLVVAPPASATSV